MVMSGFDGFNVEITLAPRALKILLEALRIASNSTTSVVSINDRMKAAGFKLENSDVAAVLTQMKLTISPLADAVVHSEMTTNVQTQISKPGPVM